MCDFLYIFKKKFRLLFCSKLIVKSCSVHNLHKAVILNIKKAECVTFPRTFWKKREGVEVT